MAKLDEGAQAPTFTLPDQDGNPVSLDDFKGTKVLVYFYPADDTPGCTKEACQFNDNLAGFQAAGVPVIGVSPDDASSHQRFRNKYGLRFPLLTDADHAVMDAWGAWGRRPATAAPRSASCAPPSSSTRTAGSSAPGTTSRPTATPPRSSPTSGADQLAPAGLLAAGGDDAGLAPAGGAAVGRGVDGVDGEAGAGEEPGDDRVGAPHVAGGQLVPAPGGGGEGGDQVEQAAGLEGVVADGLGAGDRLGGVGDDAVAPAADLVAEGAEAGQAAAGDRALDDRAAGPALGVGDGPGASRPRSVPRGGAPRARRGRGRGAPPLQEGVDGPPRRGRSGARTSRPHPAGASTGRCRPRDAGGPPGRTSVLTAMVAAGGGAARGERPLSAGTPRLGRPGHGRGQRGPRVGRGGRPAGDHLGVGADQDRAAGAETEGAGGPGVQGADLQGERHGGGRRRPRRSASGPVSRVRPGPRRSRVERRWPLPPGSQACGRRPLRSSASASAPDGAGPSWAERAARRAPTGRHSAS